MSCQNKKVKLLKENVSWILSLHAVLLCFTSRFYFGFSDTKVHKPVNKYRQQKNQWRVDKSGKKISKNLFLFVNNLV